MENIYTNELRMLVEEIPNTSAYKRGIKKYTDELLDNLEEMARIYKRLPKDENELESWLLKGARNWEEYSYGGCSLKYNRQIAERLCNPSELKKKGGGRIVPKRGETWFDEQTKALNCACFRIKSKFRLLENPQIDLKGGGGII